MKNLDFSQKSLLCNQTYRLCVRYSFILFIWTNLNKIGLLFHIAAIGPMGQKPNFITSSKYCIV